MTLQNLAKMQHCRVRQHDEHEELGEGEQTFLQGRESTLPIAYGQGKKS